MNDFELLVKTLLQFRNIAWLVQYFDLLKMLLGELALEDNDPRLALSLRKDKTLPVNIGNRYVLRPLPNEKIGCIVPAGFAHEAVTASLVGYFSPKTSRDAKWIIFRYPTGTLCPPVLFNAIIEASTAILSKTKRSAFRKYHKSLLYHFTMEPAVRIEVLAEITSIAGTS